MKRILLSVGCNQYKYLDHLHSAHTDAERVFKILADPARESYDHTYSRLIRSPDLASFNAAIAEFALSAEKTDTICFFFAGHSIYTLSSLYLCLSDSDTDKIAFSGVNFSELLIKLMSVSPRQINIVLDSCNSGSVGYNIGAILSESFVGKTGTTGISILTSSAANESALESPAGGFFTDQLVNILEGTTAVSSTNQFLGLGEIGDQIRHLLSEQTVNFWSLNIQGPERFALNPLHRGPQSPSDVALDTNFLAPLDPKALTEARSLLNDVDRELNARQLGEFLHREATDARRRGIEVSFLSGLHESFRARALAKEEPFLSFDITAIFGGLMVPFGTPPHFSPLLRQDNHHGQRRILEALNTDKDCLIGSGGLSSLFFLPLRLCRLLGQIGIEWVTSESTSEASFDLSKTIIEHYGNSIVCNSDEQAPSLLLFLAGAIKQGHIKEAEDVFGRLYYDLRENFARVADSHISGSDAVSFIRQKYSFQYSPDHRFHANPSDLVTLTLVGTAILGLDEAVDSTLIDIDHTNINLFIPETAKDMGSPHIDSGINHMMRLGNDFFRCKELRNILDDILSNNRKSMESVEFESLYILYCATLAYSDRCFWPILDLGNIPIARA